MVIYMTDVDQTAVWDGTQWTVLAPIAGGRNVIINGGFDIWQRGTTSTTTGNTYVADRWARAIPTGGTQSQDTDVPSTQYRYSWKHVASATNAYMQSGQQVEFQNCKQLQNQVTTISFWAKAINSNAGSTGLTVRTRTIAGVDGSCVFAGTNVDTSVTLTTSWARYTVARTMPATFGSASIELVLGSHVSGDGFFVTGIQWELGAVATPFEFEDIGTTLAKCQRYYENSYNDGVAVGTLTTTGSTSVIFSSVSGAATGFNFKVRKRATPAVRGYPYLAGTNNGVGYWTSAGDATNRAVTFGHISQNGMRYIQLTSSPTNSWYEGHYEAESEL
jgi:hypothetical protein